MNPLSCRWAAGVSLAAGCLLPVPAPAKVAPTSFKELARTAEVIAMARVEAVPAFAGLPVARAVPNQLLKGSLGEGPIHFIAGPTWSCDTSGAVAGESVLLFLNRATTDRFPRKGSKTPGAKVPVKPLYTLTHAGRGRMPLRSVRRQAHALLPFDLQLPPTVRATPGSGSERTLLMGKVLQLVRQELFRPPPRAAAVPRPGAR